MTPEEKLSVFEELYKRKYNDVVKFCSSYATHHEAEELAQDVFINVFNNLETFKGHSKLDTWLYAIARNYCNNYFRHKHCKKRFAPEISLDKLREKMAEDWRGGMGIDLKAFVDTKAENPLDAIEQQEQMKIIMRHVNRLSEKERMCILTFANNEGITYREVSNYLNIPVNTVRSRTSRSRASLRRREGSSA